MERYKKVMTVAIGKFAAWSKTPVACALFYLLFAGILPVLALLIFGPNSSGKPIWPALYFFTYAHLFLYPIFFGPFFAYLLSKSFGIVVQNHKDWPSFLLLPGILAVIAPLAVYCSGTCAIWETTQVSAWAESHFTRDFQNDAEGFDLDTNGTAFLAELDAAPKNLVVRVSYYTSMAIQTFCSILFFELLAFTAMNGQIDRAIETKQKTLVIMTLGYVVSLWWPCLRTIYLFTEKRFLYGPANSNFFLLDMLIIFLYLFGFIYLFTAMHFKFEERTKAVIAAMNFIGIGSLGLTAAFFNTIPSDFLRTRSVFEYIFAVFCFVLVAVPWWWQKK